MKRLLLFLLGTLPIMAFAQNFGKKGQCIDDLVPQGFDYVKAEGDLNKDGRSDLVVSARSVLAIFFALPSGGYELWKQYDNIFPQDDPDDELMLDIELSISDRGVLRIAIHSFASAGTSYVTNNSYAFRFQNNDFFKIGEDQHSMSRMTGDDETVSINYLTHKKQHIKQNAFDETIKPKETWSTIPKQPLKRLGEEPLLF